VRYKGQVWIRVGPRRAIASEQEERILSERRVSSQCTFDARPCREAKLEDLSIPFFTAYRAKAVAADVIAANHRSIEEQLASLRFYDLNANCPTFGGIIAFCDRPTYFLPGAYVQWCRFRGTEMDEKPIDQAEIRGDLLHIVRELDVYSKVSIRSVLRNITHMQEELVPNYPWPAIRELLYNAVIHRDYQDTAPIRFFWFDDHIRIYNSGGLYGPVTPKTLTTSSSYRNPVITETMKTLGYINRYGYGIQSVMRLLARNEQRPPDIVCDDRYFDVSIYARDLDNLPNYPNFSPNSPNHLVK
jgi:ATP-dependent DNA helicase RecG